MDTSVLKTALAHSLDADKSIREKATSSLKVLQQSPGFCVALLQIIESSPQNITTAELDQSNSGMKLAAAIYFKNYVKKGWDPESEEFRISDGDKLLVKKNLVSLMCSVPQNLILQLTEVVRIVGEFDFPDNWTNLVPDIKQQLFSTSDFKIINGMLLTMNILFKMFRDKEATDPLWLKLKYVLENLQEDMLQLFMKVADMVKTQRNIELLISMRLLCRIFYSLNWQTIPEFYEDNIAKYMEKFHDLLSINAYSNDFDDMIKKIQSAVVINIKLYAEKYEEEFQPFLEGFTLDVWTLLTNCESNDSFDELVSTGLAFLTTLVSKTMHKSLFSGQGVLQSICEKVIIPNLMIRQYDIENFEDNPLDYIRADLENGDQISRRKNAIELLRCATRQFEPEITAISLTSLQNVFQLSPDSSVNDGSKITRMLREADAKNIANLVKNFDVGITLFVAVCATKYTFLNGASEINSNLDVNVFYKTVILPILQEMLSKSGEDVIKNLLLSDCIKFAIVFRRQIAVADFGHLLSILVGLISNDSFIVHTYAAIAIERFLSIKEETVSVNGRTTISYKYDMNAIHSSLSTLLTCLFDKTERNIVELEEYNEYMVKTIMRVVTIAGNEIIQFTEVVVDKLCAILVHVCQTPQNPMFIHYVFENLAAIVSLAIRKKKATVEQFEGKLFGFFQQILQNDVTELVPYVFQIMAQLLELSDGPISAGYMTIFPALLMPVIWENQGNNPVLVRLLSAFLQKNNQASNKNVIISENNLNNLEGLLGIFQKLMSLTSTESYGLKLVTKIVQFVDPNFYANYLKTVFEIIFMKFQKRKTDMATKKEFILFVSILGQRIGTMKVISVVNSTIANPAVNLFAQLLPMIYLGSLKSFSDSLERKSAAVGITSILTDTNGLFLSASRELGSQIFSELVQMLDKSDSVEEKGTETADKLLESLEETGYSSNYATLAHAKVHEMDPFPEIHDSKIYFVKKLHEYASSNPGVLNGFLSQALAKPEVREAFQKFMQAAKITQFA